MKKITLLVGFVLMIVSLSGCVQPTAPGTSMEFTFANEATFDTTITAFIDGEKVYEKELISSTTAGGYFGQESDHKTFEVPDKAFTLKVIESATGIEEMEEINPTNGKYMDVTFWTDRFDVQQTENKQVRID